MKNFLHYRTIVYILAASKHRRRIIPQARADAMVVGFEKIEQVDGCAACVRKVPVAGGEVRALARRAARVA